MKNENIDFTKNLEINRIWMNRDIEHGVYGAFGIDWSGDIGFGRYTVYIDENGNIFGESECLDSNENKSFLKALLEKLVEKIQIVE